MQVVDWSWHSQSQILVVSTVLFTDQCYQFYISAPVWSIFSELWALVPLWAVYTSSVKTLHIFYFIHLAYKMWFRPVTPYGVPCSHYSQADVCCQCLVGFCIRLWPFTPRGCPSTGQTEWPVFWRRYHHSRFGRPRWRRSVRDSTA